MANVFEQYGIKEVADVTIYRVTKDPATGAETETPFLFLDTLKVSTLEQTSEQSDARGGKGNPKLITWDYGKEINVTLEDALYSPASMALMWGGKDSAFKTVSRKLEKFLKYKTKEEGEDLKTVQDGKGNAWTVKGYFLDNGTYSATVPTSIPKNKVLNLKVEDQRNVQVLEITADDFPGTYKVIGDTYARNRNTGEDEYFQFIIHRAKMSTEQTLTLQAEGDPTTFNLNMTVLRPEAGPMMELIQYTIPDGTADGKDE
jgi:hypothetical protein